jgi:serine-type D-Ala-D-Ala carboxypeptidase/endopeptidase
MSSGLWLVCHLAACAASPPPRDAAPAPPAPAPAEPVTSPAVPGRRLPSDAEVQRILDERVGELGEYHGIVVGLVDASGRRVISRGSLGKGSGRALDGDTLFELGSISKVFTALLLAIAVERGEMGLDDPLAKHLRSRSPVPSFDGQSITLRHLATHTSGLPRVPTNLAPRDPLDPYAEYTVEDLYEFLATYSLTRAPGSSYEYSNLGAALLARALIVRTGKTYAELVRERIAEPLGLRHTWVDVPEAEKASLAIGHTQGLYVAPLRTRVAMIGNGGVFSSANDLLTFLSASMGSLETPLASAFAQIATAQRPIGERGGSIALGWHIARAGGADVVWHNGGTAGFGSFTGYLPDAKLGVVALTNVSSNGGVDDIGMHLIAETPLLPAGTPSISLTRPREQVAIEPRRLDAYVGTYQLGKGDTLHVKRENEQLIVELSERARFPIFPESETVFFMKVMDITFRFETGVAGVAVAVVMGQGGKEHRFPRAPATAKKGPAL